MTVDAVALTQALVRCESVTPLEAGALDVLESALKNLGFMTRRMPYEEPGTAPVDNLYARFGTSGPNLCFAGHVDVVPVGDAAAWDIPPFWAEVKDGILHGRGSADMKGAIGAFVAAAAEAIAEAPVAGSLSFLITGDEEGPAVNGTRKMLETLHQEGEVIDYCIVGEPTNPEILGEMMKIGRRGSMNVRLRVRGQQGHVAYPHLADNPVPKLHRLLAQLPHGPLDEGTDYFQPSNLEVTALSTTSQVHNVIPAEATALLNIRFSDLHTGESLTQEISRLLDEAQIPHDRECHVTGEAFLFEPGRLAHSLKAAISVVTGQEPRFSTSGGTSDARFIKDYAEVVEFGLIGKTIHMVNEHVAVDDIIALKDIYRRVIADLLQSS